ncbi:MAG TPA: hypothetical protein VEV83_10335 [Parafilimonas sp.]|nr:hypothetical protein [Parafilimonas sp.]
MSEQINNFALAELYSKSLVITDDSQPRLPVQPNITASKNNFLGKYEKKIIIAVNDSQNLYLDDESLQFLTGILSACKLNLAHIALINFHHEPTTFAQLKKQMQPEYLLMFGVTPVQIELPFIMPDYKVQSFDNCFFLTAPALPALNQNSEQSKKEKGKLWNSLKKMFDIK